MSFGYGLGGDRLVTLIRSDGSTDTIDAGQGGIFGVGAMATPIWLGDQVGFGASFDIALKYTSATASNGSVDLTRYPMMFRLHLLLGDGATFLVLKGGVDKDLDVAMSASGVISGGASLKSHWGPTGAIGAYHRSSVAFAEEVSFYVTSIQYEDDAGSRASASSGGITVALHINL